MMKLAQGCALQTPGSHCSTLLLSELFEETKIVLVEKANVMDVVTNHRDSFDAKSERPTGPHFRIVTDVFKYLRMNHPAAGDLQPILSHLLHERTGKIDFEAGLRIRKVVRPKPKLYVAAEQVFENKLHRSLQIAHRHVAVYIKSFDLLEGWIVCGICVVPPVDPARCDDADRRRLAFHHPNLHGRSVRPQ